MSEPITLHDGAGNTLTVYTRSHAEGLLSGGQWFATEAEAQGYTATPPAPPAAKPAAAPVEDKPKPTAAKKTERKP